jgi:hypothetical protein
MILQEGKLNPEAKKTGVSGMFCGTFLPYFLERAMLDEVDELL